MLKNTGMHATTKRLFDALVELAKIDGYKEPGKAAQFLGESAATITNWKSRGISKQGILKANKLFGIDPRWLESGEGDMLPEGRRVEPNVEAGPAVKPTREIPVVGEVKGGDDGYLTELDYPVGHGEGVVDYPTSDPCAYALRVRGDSMHPRYRAGEFVVVEPSLEAQPGDDVVVALHDGRKLLKELNWARDGEVQLLSINNHFGPLTIPLAEILRIQLVAGRVRRGAIRR
ncbi:S24 family peptidase [Malikia spinosa]|nr:helix-turn-helix transcriptional regulator [Malikia spinosa]